MWQDIKNIYHLLVAFFVNFYYGFPSRRLTIIGVTGTSGKTTTTHMIYEILKNAGYKVSILSTIKAVIGGKEYDTGFHVTTPDPHVLPKFLHQAILNKDKYFVLEVSSHGLDQNRAAFIHFHIGVLTTLAHEHLDYHKTFLAYAKAKFKLLHQADQVVIPIQSLSDEIKQSVGFDSIKKKMITFGINNGDHTQNKWNLNLKIPGDFNLMNALSAAAVGNILNIPKITIRHALENFTSLIGRFEEILTEKDFRVIIDFAHKPDALEEVLKTARKEVGNRVITMFGCASERDILKRPIMGEISGRLADITVLTDEDPRQEDSMKIINEIAQGCIKSGAKEVSKDSKDFFSLKDHLFLKIPDREQAIKFIIQKLAKKGDLILLCGKGHEKSMNYNGFEKPWNEYDTVRKALKINK